ncbi:MAG: tetratricopeptide repeat protein [Bacteroidia bacterium]
MLKGLFNCFLVFCFVLPFANLANAQKTLVYEDHSSVYKQALELFDKEKYAPAQVHFREFASITSDRGNKINAEYYAAVCAMELFNPDAVPLLKEVHEKYPESPKANLALFQLGKYYYRNKENKVAIKYLEEVAAGDLTPAEASEYWFIKGYCLFKSEKFDEAKTAFNNIKEQNGKYFDASNYYFGYVLYRQNNFDEALAHFTRINKSKTFGPLSQVYVAQILFSKKQYAEVVSFADTIKSKEILTDVSGICGQSHFNLGEYGKAIPFLERFNQNSPVGKRKQDIYRLGYAYFKSLQFEKAADQFSQITDDNDSTSQFASFHLAQCYVNAGNKDAARLAFDKAYHINFNKRISEISLFNSAKLSYELSNQQDALKDFAKFMTEFPNSDFNDEAKTDLGNLLLGTKNYKEAIRIIESIKNPNNENKMAFQRVCYYRAEELFLNNDFKGSEELFKKSMQYEFDKKLFAQSHFFMGELSYRQNLFSDAFDHFNKFQSFAEIKETRFYNLAFYNKGYCSLKEEKYAQAIEELTKFLATDFSKLNKEMMTDATLRTADCQFVLHQYPKAVESYDVVIRNKWNGADYALYQKSMILGVLSKPLEKVATLEQIKTDYPKSPYIDDALFEIANVKLQTEKYDDAVNEFQYIIENYPRCPYIRQSLLNKGLAYYNSNREEKALNEFKQLITNYSTSDEARQALVVIKNIFVNKGESEAYLDFIKVLPNVVISPSYQDSVTFESAFNIYKNGDCNKASRSFANYITKFSGGYFILKANYYKAECDFKNKNYDSCLGNYEFVATYNRNDFTERATRQCAVLYFMKKNYNKAYEYYSILERIAGGSDNLAVAYLGEMKSAELLNKIDSAAASAFKYLNSTLTQKEGVDDAHLNIGRYYMLHNQPDSALPYFQLVIKETRNEQAAESKYNLARIQFLKKELKQAKKTVFDLNQNFSSYEFWTAKGFILLADIYSAMKDHFQAKATLQSVIDNVDNETLKNEAREKLKALFAAEEATKPAVKPEEEKEVELKN